MVSRDKSLTREAINQLCKVWLHKALDEAEMDLAMNGPSIDPRSAGPDEDTVADFLSNAAVEHREMLACNQLQPVEPFVDEVLNEEGYALEKGSGHYRLMCRAMLRAMVEYHDVLSERSLGWYPSLMEGAIRGEGVPSHAFDEDMPCLSELVEPYLKQRVESQKSSNHDIFFQLRSTLVEFVDFHGNKPINTYTKRHLSEYRDAVLTLPSKHAQLRDWKGLSFTEKLDKIEGDDYEGDTVTPQTVKRKFSELSGLFDWAQERVDCELSNPTKGFKWPKRMAAREQGTPFAEEELKLLFQQPIWTGSFPTFRNKPGEHIIRDSRYFLPLISLYSGMRLTEAAQLHVSDLREEEGVWFFDINEDGDLKRLKTHSSRRIVPIHPELVCYGLLEHLQQMEKKREQRLWPELSPGGPNQSLGTYAGKQFRETRLAAGLTRPLLTFRSFRRTFGTALHNAGVSEEVASALMGHANTSITYNRYSSGITNLGMLKEAICRVKYHLK